MENTRKSYAIVYVTESTSIEEMESIEKVLQQHQVEVELFDSRTTYRDWCKDKNSINPSLFISNGVSIDNEFQFLNEKLTDAVILLIGDLSKITGKKINGRTKDQENFFKKCKDHHDLMEYLSKVAFTSPRFTEKVFERKEKSIASSTPQQEKSKPTDQPKEMKKEMKMEQISNTPVQQIQTPVSPAVPPSTAKEGEEDPAEFKQSQQEANIEKQQEYEQQVADLEHQIKSSPPLFEEEEERLQERLQTITEVANKSKQKQESSAAPSTKTVSITAPPASTTKETTIVYEENPYHKRSRHLQKQVFAKQKWENHRTIGVWSPIHRMGVTSFTINFALFLAENRVYTAVLEGLTEQHALKSWLQRYSSIPTNWSSYAKAIHSDDTQIDDTEWIYRDVTFLPLDTNDPQFEWNALSLESYMTTTNVIDITLVDFPTGKMTTYTEDSLHYVDELWILIDDAAQETLAWKEYIQTIQEKVDVPIYLLFNKTYEFSQVDRLSKEYQIPLLSKLPALHEETMRNYYETIPLYCKKEVQEKLQVSFSEIVKHLLGKDFPINEKIPNVPKKKWTDKFLKILKAT